LTTDRWRIDPEHRYPADGLRRVEDLAMRVLDFMPDAQVERTRDAIQFEHGGERGVVVLVTAEAVEFRLPTLEWTHPHFATPSSRLWKRVRAEKLYDGQPALGELLERARAARARQFKKCKYCKELFPPEHRHSGNVCHGCAERHEGVVH
jgi:hypothetical protein